MKKRDYIPARACCNALFSEAPFIIFILHGDEKNQKTIVTDTILPSPALPSPRVHSGGGGDALPAASPAGDAPLHLHGDEAQWDLVIKLPKNAPSALLYHNPLIKQQG